MEQPGLNGDRNSMQGITRDALRESKGCGEVGCGLTPGRAVDGGMEQFEEFLSVLTDRSSHGVKIAAGVGILGASGFARGEGDGVRRPFRLGIGMRDARRSVDEVGQMPFVAGDETEQWRTHRRPVACREDAAAIRREAETEPETGEKRRLADSGGHSAEPTPESSCELPLEFAGVEAGGNEGLRNEAGMLGVVGNHAATKEETVPVRRAKKFLCAAAGEVLVGKSDGVTDGRPQ